jgi:cytochrome c oxidase subunit 2
MAFDEAEDLKPTPGQRLRSFVQRKDVAQTIVLGVVITAFFVVLGLYGYPNWMPAVHSKEMHSAREIMTIFTVLSAPIAGFVLSIAVRAFLNMHRGNTPPPDQDVSEKSNTPAILVWCFSTGAFVVAAIVIGLLAYNSDTNSAVADAPKARTVDVTGAQWVWSFYYPAQNIQTHTLELPTGQPVEFDVKSVDVNHSFWPVQLGIKVDANRLVTTTAEARPTTLGPIDIRCAELCGLNHAFMQTSGAVVSENDFNNWVNSIKASGGIEQ